MQIRLAYQNTFNNSLLLTELLFLLYYQKLFSSKLVFILDSSIFLIVVINSCISKLEWSAPSVNCTPA